MTKYSDPTPSDFLPPADGSPPPRITRSAGVPTGLGFIVGGGWSGFTAELDQAVCEAAEALADAFPGFGVEIRFNSDRRSGGAWLKTGGEGVEADTLVGIGSGYNQTRDEALAALSRFDIDPDSAKGRYWLDGADGALYIEARVHASALADTSIIDIDGGGHPKPYATARRFPTVAAAAAWTAEVSVVADAAEMARRSRLWSETTAAIERIKDSADNEAAKALKAFRRNPDRAEQVLDQIRSNKKDAEAAARRRYWEAIASRATSL